MEVAVVMAQHSRRALISLVTAAMVALSGAVLAAPASAAAAGITGLQVIGGGSGFLVPVQGFSVPAPDITVTTGPLAGGETITLSLDRQVSFAGVGSVTQTVGGVPGSLTANVSRGEISVTANATTDSPTVTFTFSGITINVPSTRTGVVQVSANGDRAADYIRVVTPAVSLSSQTIPAGTARQGIGDVDVALPWWPGTVGDVTVTFANRSGTARATDLRGGRSDGHAQIRTPSRQTIIGTVRSSTRTVTFTPNEIGTYTILNLSLAASGEGTIDATATGEPWIPASAVIRSSQVITVSAATSGRISGADRFATSAEIARQFWATDSGLNTAIIVNGEESRGGADALAANYLAGQAKAPVLLTGRDGLPSSVLAALNTRARALGGTLRTVYVLGDQNAVSDAVATQLRSLVGSTSDVVRLAGSTRFATASAIASLGDAGSFRPVANGPAHRTAFLASGWSPVDALVAGPLAYAQGFPVLLTERGTLSAEAAAGIAAQRIEHVIVLGDTNAVSAAVVSAVQSLRVGGAAVSVQRIGGANRFATAQQLNTTAVRSTAQGGLGRAVSTAYLSNGWGFADALAAGPLAGKDAGLIVPVHADSLPGESETFLRANRTSVHDIVALGGTGRVSARALDAAVAATR